MIVRSYGHIYKKYSSLAPLVIRRKVHFLSFVLTGLIGIGVFEPLGDSHPPLTLTRSGHIGFGRLIGARSTSRYSGVLISLFLLLTCSAV